MMNLLELLMENILTIAILVLLNLKSQIDIYSEEGFIEKQLTKPSMKGSK